MLCRTIGEIASYFELLSLSILQYNDVFYMSSTSAYHTKYTINKYQVPLIVYWFDDTCKSKKCECECVCVYVCLFVSVV